MKLLSVFLLGLGLLCCLPSRATAQAPADSTMRTYYMVLLRKGPHRDQPAAEAERIQAGHMAHIQAMHKAGKLVLAGPFLDDGDIRGIFLFMASSLDEVKALTAQDPAVQAGRLLMDIRPWYGPRGACLPN